MRKSSHKTILTTTLVVILMFGFTFAIVPIYNKLCRITGLSTAVPSWVLPDLSRQITVQFTTTTNQTLACEFKPLQNDIKVHPNENNHVWFYIKNNTNKTLTLQAIPSIVPGVAVKYFHKIECFCFKQQTLKAGQALKMPMVFSLDKEIPAELNTISVGYTLFDVTQQKRGSYETTLPKTN